MQNCPRPRLLAVEGAKVVGLTPLRHRSPRLSKNGLESRPQRFVKLPADVDAVKNYIAEYAISDAEAHPA